MRAPRFRAGFGPGGVPAPIAPGERHWRRPPRPPTLPGLWGCPYGAARLQALAAPAAPSGGPPRESNSRRLSVEGRQERAEHRRRTTAGDSGRTAFPGQLDRPDHPPGLVRPTPHPAWARGALELTAAGFGSAHTAQRHPLRLGALNRAEHHRGTTAWTPCAQPLLGDERLPGLPAPRLPSACPQPLTLRNLAPRLPSAPYATRQIAPKKNTGEHPTPTLRATLHHSPAAENHSTEYPIPTISLGRLPESRRFVFPHSTTSPRHCGMISNPRLPRGVGGCGSRWQSFPEAANRLASPPAPTAVPPPLARWPEG